MLTVMPSIMRDRVHVCLDLLEILFSVVYKFVAVDTINNVQAVLNVTTTFVPSHAHQIVIVLAPNCVFKIFVNHPVKQIQHAVIKCFA